MRGRAQVPLQDRQVTKEGPTPVPVRVSPADRVRYHIDELFAQDRPPVQSVKYLEVRALLGQLAVLAVVFRISAPRRMKRAAVRCAPPYVTTCAVCIEIGAIVSRPVPGFQIISDVQMCRAVSSTNPAPAYGREARGRTTLYLAVDPYLSAGVGTVRTEGRISGIASPIDRINVEESFIVCRCAGNTSAGRPQ